MTSKTLHYLPTKHAEVEEALELILGIDIPDCGYIQPTSKGDEDSAGTAKPRPTNMNDAFQIKENLGFIQIYGEGRSISISPNGAYQIQYRPPNNESCQYQEPYAGQFDATTMEALRDFIHSPTVTPDRCYEDGAAVLCMTP